MFASGALTTMWSMGPPAARTERNGWLQRMVWDRRAGAWDGGGATGLVAVVEAVLREAPAGPGTLAVDLGCGTGQLALPLAETGASVTAVDLSEAMIDLLHEKAAAAGLGTVTGVVSAMETFSLPPQSADIVVSNYAFHHLTDRDKPAVVAAAASWLRPGGRLVLGDMMFGRGATTQDRAVIGAKVAVMLRRGPAGWWRLAKNVVRFSLRVQERPVPAATWRRHFEAAGLKVVAVVPVVSEAVVMVGVKPAG